MLKQQLLKIQEKGRLPWKNFKGNWCVTYLDNGSGGGGVYDAEFDTLFEALKFARGLR